MFINETYTITVREVYGKCVSDITVPEGWELTGKFRPGKECDYWLSNGTVPTVYHWECLTNSPRLILRKKLTPTIYSVYGKLREELTAPKGYEFTGEFRQIKAGDSALDSQSYGAIHWIENHPELYRLILRALPKRKRVIFEATGEVRVPRKGEWFSGELNGSIWFEQDNFLATATKPREIWTQREEEF